MLELKHAGLYIANGSRTSVLIRVTGEYPMLDIVSGVLLNDMQQDGTITPLSKDSIEIQDILLNPSKYIFDLPAISDAANNKQGLGKSENKRIEYRDEDFNHWMDSYKRLRRMYPEDYFVKMEVELIQYGFSKPQADLIIGQIESRIKREAYVR